MAWAYCSLLFLLDASGAFVVADFLSNTSAAPSGDRFIFYDRFTMDTRCGDVKQQFRRQQI